MLFGKRNARMRGIRPIVFLPLLAVLLITLSACTIKGGIVILESLNGTGFTMEFNEWSARKRCTLSLTEGDTLQIELNRKNGEIALNISGKNGEEPYTGNDLQTGIFTVTASETDEYALTIAGQDATGTLVIKNLSGEA